MTFFEKSIFQFFIISRVIFDLQRRTIPQINHLNILFWPFELTFVGRMDIWGDRKQRKCPVFFLQTLYNTHSWTLVSGLFDMKNIIKPLLFWLSTNLRMHHMKQEKEGLDAWKVIMTSQNSYCPLLGAKQNASWGCRSRDLLKW